MDDHDLLKLQFVGFPDDVVRAVDPKYADQAGIDPDRYVAQTLIFNQASGGRYNAPGEFGALYTASNEYTAWAELHARFLREGIPGLPRTMGLIRLNILAGQFIDLNESEARDAWDISIDSIHAEDPTPEQKDDCFRLGRAARVVADFVRAPSARADGDNIPLFIGSRPTGDFDWRLSSADPARLTPSELHAPAAEIWD